LIGAFEVTAERIGIVAHIHRDYGVFRALPGERGKYRGGVDPVAVLPRCPALLLFAPQLPTLLQVGPLIDAGEVGRNIAQQPAGRNAHLAPDGYVHCVEFSQGHPLEVHLDNSLLRGDASVVGERGAEHDKQIGFVHAPTGDGCAAAPQYARGQGMFVSDLTLGLEGS